MAELKQINFNNWLIWHGRFTKAVPATIANNDTAQITIGAESVDIYPLVNDQSVFGINANTFEFTFQDNAVSPATWDKVAKKVTYYPPADVLPNTVRQLKYRWYDTSGNVSNEGTISIAVNDMASAWRPQWGSRVCIVDGNGDRTGVMAFTTLEKYYPANNQLYNPYTTKANTEGQPDYIAPEVNHAECPLPLVNMPHVPGIVAVEYTGGMPDGPRIHAYIVENTPVEQDINVYGSFVSYYGSYKITSYSVTIPAGQLEGYSEYYWPGQDSGDYLFAGQPEMFPESVKKQNIAEIFDFTTQIV